MFHLLILLATFSLSQANVATNQTNLSQKGFLDFFLFNDQCDCRCGVPNREGRLIGGEYLKTYEFPWLAQIQVRDGQAVLPAVLINDKYVLTSAANVVGFTPYDLKVTLGQFDRCFPDVSSQNVSVDAVILHPEFSPGNRANDLALIRLSSPLTFERRIQPICLALPGKRYVGQVATVTNWAEGAATAGQDGETCRPRKAGLPVLGYVECIGTALDPQYTSADKGCLGVIGTKSIICESDAGGPVMYRSYGGIYELIGILSDKNNCEDGPSTALYTQVNKHLNWIKETTRDACYCLRNK